MKIVRLTENNGQTAYFDNIFNDEIELPPFSEVALSSVSINANQNFIEISQSDDIIPWGVNSRTKPPGQREIELDKASYDATTYERLFFDMYATMNGDIDPTASLGASTIKSPETGLQWIVSDDPKISGFGSVSKVSIGYQVANYEGADSTSYKATNTAISGTAGLSTEVQRSGGTPYTADAALCGTAPFGWGGARTYINLKKVTVTGAGGPEGVIFGLTTTNHAALSTIPTPNSGLIEIYSFGVGSQYTWSINGTTFTGTDTGAAIAEGDLVGFERVGQEGYIQGVVYDSAGNRRVLDGGNTPTTGECEVQWQQYHDAGTTKPLDLFPYIMCVGAAADVIVDKLQFSPDPYNIIKNKQYSIITKTNGGRGLQNGGVLTPRTTMFIDFTVRDGNKLAKYLGFTPQQITELKQDQAVTPDKFAWTATNLFSAGLLAQGFYVELMTGTCEGYDGLTGQRKNILAVIPESDSDNKLLFQPSFPIFLEMNNSNPLVLRNIRARVLQTDGSSLGVTGQNSLTLLYKPGKSE